MNTESSLIPDAREWDLPEALPIAEGDPSFRIMADGMGLLEWCLLYVAGRSDEELAGLRKVVGSARSRTRVVDREEKPSASAGDETGPIVRRLRAGILSELLDHDAIAEPAGVWGKTRNAFERACLALPAAYDRHRLERFAAGLASRRRGMFLLWHAERLLNDTDATRARAFLDAVPTDVSNGDAARRIAALSESLELDREPRGKIKLGEDLVTLKFPLQAWSRLPEGQAAFLVGYEDDKLAASPPGNGARAWGAELVRIGGLNSREPVGLEVSRVGFDGDAAVSSFLTASVFYRGTTIRTSEPVAFDLPAIKKQYFLQFRSARHSACSTAQFKGGKIPDQLVKHPDKCFLYTGADHQLDLEITYHPESGEPARKNVFVTASLGDKIVGLEAIDGKKASTTSSVELVESKSVKLRFENIRSQDVGEKGAVFRVIIQNDKKSAMLTDASLLVRVIDPVPYYPAEARVFGNRCRIRISRSGADPISREMAVQAEVVGGTLRAIRHSNPTADQFYVDHAAELAKFAVPLVHGNSAYFDFEMTESEEEPVCHAWLQGQKYQPDVKMPAKPPPNPLAPAQPGAPVPAVPGARPETR